MSASTSGIKSPRIKELSIAVAAIGIVFGDIGTSPLYALRECFSSSQGMSPTPANVVGIVSLLIWTLTLVVCVKYLGFVLRADNKGEGGILALVNLISRWVPASHNRRTLFVGALGIIGASLLYSDGILTPAVSVLSAVEGLTIVSPSCAEWIIPLSLMVLVVLFLFQSRGTHTMGRVFGPILTVWFLVIGIIGLAAIVHAPGILAALNPLEGIAFFVRNGVRSLGVMGLVFLAMTGAEVLYSDLGHFGRSPIRRSWFALVYPCLLLNYVGQGAFLLAHPADTNNLFFRLVPQWGVIPLVGLATAATIIASQAVITGSFSLAQQSVQLGLWPRIQVRHTSDETIGQVYVPVINWFLLFGTIALVLGFKSSGNLTYAYGIAISATMLITSCLMIYLARRAWKIPLWIVIPLGVVFLAIDSIFFVANSMKLLSGGWVVILFSVGIFAMMKTWVDGRTLFAKKIEKYRVSPELFIPGIAENPPERIAGTAIFLTADPKGLPKALLHNLKHNKVLHSLTILLSVQTTTEPYVDEVRRIETRDYGLGLWHVVLYYGFSESPDLPRDLSHLEIPGFSNDPMQLSYFLGREAIAIGSSRNGMARWRKRLFAFMFKNAASPMDFFHIPPERVVEIGAKMEL